MLTLKLYKAFINNIILNLKNSIKILSYVVYINLRKDYLIRAFLIVLTSNMLKVLLNTRFIYYNSVYKC